MQNITRSSLILSLSALALILAGCASSGASARSSASVKVAPSERLFLQVAPFDSVVRAEVLRGGLDAEQVEQDFAAELRYQFALRRQEEAVDSAGAVVGLRVEVQHLQPGAGNAGSFAAVRMVSIRGGEETSVEWNWRPSARENVPPSHAGRHLIRSLSHEVLARVKASRPSRFGHELEGPPPLILLK